MQKIKMIKERAELLRVQEEYKEPLAGVAKKYLFQSDTKSKETTTVSSNNGDSTHGYGDEYNPYQ